MKDCIFCKIAAGQLPCEKVYEEDDVLAFMDINPVSYGHILVIPKQHYEYVHQCPASLFAKVSAVVPKISSAVYEVTGADGYNTLCNSGTAAGQVVPHLHYHIIPRFTGDGVFKRWPSGKYDSEDEMKEICGKIRRKI